MATGAREVPNDHAIVWGRSITRTSLWTENIFKDLLIMGRNSKCVGTTEIGERLHFGIGFWLFVVSRPLSVAFRQTRPRNGSLPPLPSPTRSIRAICRPFSQSCRQRENLMHQVYGVKNWISPRPFLSSRAGSGRWYSMSQRPQTLSC